jgi:hypothetical protein
MVCIIIIVAIFLLVILLLLLLLVEVKDCTMGNFINNLVVIIHIEMWSNPR